MLSFDSKNRLVVFDRIIRFRNNFPLATLGGVLVILFVIAAAFAPFLAPYDPNRMILRNSFLPPGTPEHLLGTDYSGRDMLSRLIYGARVSLLISSMSVSLGAMLGVFLGITAAWFKKIQSPIMRLVDIMLSFPSIIVALTIISILGTGVSNLIFAICIGNIPVFARLAYGQTLLVRNLEYVEAAVALGADVRRIVWYHILPNITAPVIVQFTLVIPQAIMVTAGLSFLGLGVMPPTAEWGNMLQDSLRWVIKGPHTMYLPGLILMLVVFGFNTLGDGLRVALDPRTGKL